MYPDNAGAFRLRLEHSWDCNLVECFILCPKGLIFYSFPNNGVTIQKLSAIIGIDRYYATIKWKNYAIKPLHNWKPHVEKRIFIVCIFDSVIIEDIFSGVVNEVVCFEGGLFRECNWGYIFWYRSWGWLLFFYGGAIEEVFFTGGVIEEVFFTGGAIEEAFFTGGVVEEVFLLAV